MAIRLATENGELVIENPNSPEGLIRRHIRELENLYEAEKENKKICHIIMGLLWVYMALGWAFKGDNRESNEDIELAQKYLSS